MMEVHGTLQHASGAMQTGVVEVDGKVYYLAPSGAMATGNVTIDGVTYTFAASGEAIGDKIPTPTLAFTSAGTAVTLSKTTRYNNRQVLHQFIRWWWSEVHHATTSTFSSSYK